MVRISVLNDCLNNIVNAERRGKRQVSFPLVLGPFRLPPLPLLLTSRLLEEVSTGGVDVHRRVVKNDARGMHCDGRHGTMYQAQASHPRPNREEGEAELSRKRREIDQLDYSQTTRPSGWINLIVFPPSKPTFSISVDGTNDALTRCKQHHSENNLPFSWADLT